MLLAVMVLCAVGVVALVCLELLSDVWNAWSHPEHKFTDEPPFTKLRPR
jgi:hypothetical protein